MFAGQKTIENLLNKNEQEAENTIQGWNEEDEELEDTESQNRDLAADEIRATASVSAIT